MKNRVKKEFQHTESLAVIPNCDNLFLTENTIKGKKKSGFLRNLFSLNRTPIILSFFLYFVQCLPIYVTPIITAEIINLVTQSITTKDVSNTTINYVIIYAIILFVVLIQNLPTTRLRFKIVSKMLRRTSAGIKSSVVRRLQTLSLTYHKEIETGRIQSKFIKDTEDVDTYLSQLIQHIIPSILSTIVYIFISVYNNGIVSLFFLLLIPINVAVAANFRTRLRKSNREYRLTVESMSARLNTMLDMIPVTKSHGLEELEIDSVESRIKEVQGAGIEVDKNTAFFGALMYVVPHVLSAICLIFCAVLAIYGYLSVGDIVLFQSLFTMLSNSITSIINSLPQITKGSEAINSISEIMHADDLELSLGKTTLENINGNLIFENVYYRYNNNKFDTIKDFSLSVKAGECIAVVGSSGSGKTTIMNLIIGFMMPTQGDIKIDNNSIKNINLSNYRHNISVVPQNSILFNGTIKDNITYGLPNYTEEELEKAIEIANLKEFISELPNGVNTVIGENGSKLSGGQKQRITIARAVIRNPKILILDEATSALDNVSEYHVQKAISSSIKGRTTFIVAHRLSTIRNADRIVVMENGQIAEIGTYDQLVEKQGKFYQLKCLNDANQKIADDELK